MHNQGTRCRAALDRINTGHSLGIESVRSESVHGFSGKSDKPSGAQELCCVVDF